MISYDEFVVMIRSRPWKNLLPIEVQALLPSWPVTSPPRPVSPSRRAAPIGAPSIAIAGATRSSAAASLGNTVSGSVGAAAHAQFKAEQQEHQAVHTSAVAAAAFLRAAKQLFKHTDTDGNGMVDLPELVECLRELHASHGQAHCDPLDTLDVAQAAMVEHGTNGFMAFEGFLRVIASPGFIAILPKEMQDIVLSQAHTHAKQEMAKNTAKAAAGMAVMRAAKQIFTDADADKNGSIDREEFAWLVKQLWNKLGIDVPIDFQSRLEYEVENAFEQFDTNRDGVISFSEFLNMVTTDPWKALLPLEVHDHIVPFVVEADRRSRMGPPTLPMAKPPSAAVTGGRLGGAPQVTPMAGPPSFTGPYDLVGPPKTVRATSGWGHSHTRDLQYAMLETQKINSRLSVRHSAPPPLYRKHRATLPSGFTFMRY